jgi:hypothetical protein
MLQYTIDETSYNDIINLAIPEGFGQKYPILQYADDIILIMLLA